MVMCKLFLMMKSCSGGTNYDKLLKVVANSRCLGKLINRPKANLKHMNVLYGI